MAHLQDKDSHQKVLELERKPCLVGGGQGGLAESGKVTLCLGLLSTVIMEAKEWQGTDSGSGKHCVNRLETGGHYSVCQ